MEKEPITINDLSLGVVAKGFAGSEEGWPDNKENIKGARIINMDNGSVETQITKLFRIENKGIPQFPYLGNHWNRKKEQHQINDDVHSWEIG